METTTRLILPEVIEALHTSPEDLVGLTEELHPADLADLAAALEPPLAQRLITVLPVDVAARLLEIEPALTKFLTALPQKFETATGKPRFHGVVIDADERTGRATDIERLSYSAEELQFL